MGFNPFKAAEKKAKEAVNSVVRHVLNPAIDKAEDAGRAVERTAKASAAKAEEKIDDAQDAAVGAVRKAGREIEAGLEEKLPELIKDAARKLAEEASREAIGEALDNAADVIELMAPTRFQLILGLELALVVQGEVTVAVTLPNPAAKLTEIRAWATKPPRGRAQIIACIRDFAPESVSVEAKVSGNGLAAEWDGDDKYSRLDAFLEKHGV